MRTLGQQYPALGKALYTKGTAAHMKAKKTRYKFPKHESLVLSSIAKSILYDMRQFIIVCSRDTTESMQRKYARMFDDTYCPPSPNSRYQGKGP